METRVTLRPGKRGTRRWLDKYGDRLVCVRYRYDTVERRRLTTFELIVDESPRSSRPKPDANRPVDVKISYSEADLRQRVKGMGGIWRPARRVWNLPLEKVRALGLEGRIVPWRVDE